jgi:cold shock CspA family protein
MPLLVVARKYALGSISSLFAIILGVICLVSSSTTAWTSSPSCQYGRQHNKVHSSRMIMAATTTDGGYDDFVSREDWNAMNQDERNAINAKRTRDSGAAVAVAAVAVAAVAAVAVAGGTDDDSSSEMIIKGTVKWFDTKKGFGFITRDDGGEDVFVHQTALQAEGFRALEDGASVEFQLDTAGKGGRTTAVKVTGPQGEPLKRGFAYKKRE